MRDNSKMRKEPPLLELRWIKKNGFKSINQTIDEVLSFWALEYQH